MRWLTLACLTPISLLTCLAPALAWNADGVPVSRAPGSQTNPVIVLDGSGGAFIAWSDTRQDTPGHRDVFLQHLTSTGAVAPGWPADGVPVCVAPGDQFADGIARDEIGGAFVAWTYTDASYGADAYLQHMTASGLPAQGWPLNGLGVAVAPEAQGITGLVSDGAGGVFVAWDSTGVFTSGSRSYLQHLLGMGGVAPGWPASGLRLSPEYSGSGSPRLISDGNGGLLLAWSLGYSGLRAQHLTFAGDVASGWPSDGVVIPTQYVPGLRRVAVQETAKNRFEYVGEEA